MQPTGHCCWFVSPSCARDRGVRGRILANRRESRPISCAQTRAWIAATWPPVRACVASVRGCGKLRSGWPVGLTCAPHGPTPRRVQNRARSSPSTARSRRFGPPSGCTAPRSGASQRPRVVPGDRRVEEVAHRGFLRSRTGVWRAGMLTRAAGGDASVFS